ncbi:MAG: beta-N-acetylhexosaminidase, partial [Firmicutes bacterium]|nr:beta-N-acetylhexosaminidase [Bacillota bacterium]
YKLYSAQWLRENKPFGLEVQDMRIGGLMRRVKSCRLRLKEYCTDKIDSIPELEEDILPFGKPKEGHWFWHLIAVTAGIT